MELLKTALVIVLLAAVSAMPRGFRRHHDADISELKTLHASRRFIGESSESSESKSSSDESNSSEEIIFPGVTTPAVTKPTVIKPAVTTPAVIKPTVTTPAVIKPTVTPPAVTPPEMTTAEEGSSATPEVGTIGTDQPIVMETTLSPVDGTSACDQCFTAVIPTGAPITDNRGDN